MIVNFDGMNQQRVDSRFFRMMIAVRGFAPVWHRSRVASLPLDSVPKETKFLKKVSSTFSKVAAGGIRTLMLKLCRIFASFWPNKRKSPKASFSSVTLRSNGQDALLSEHFIYMRNHSIRSAEYIDDVLSLIMSLFLSCFSLLYYFLYERKNVLLSDTFLFIFIINH